MQNENLFLFSFPSVSNFSEAKVTKIESNAKMKTCFYFHSRVQVTSAKLKLRINESRTKEFILFYAEEMEYMFKNIKTIILKNDK